MSNFLTKLPSGTTVSVASNAYVAGEATYTLVISPNDPKSLITSITLSVDANNFDPLGAAINTTSGQALGISYSQLSFTKPSASVFSFVPTSSMIQKTATGQGKTSTATTPMTSNAGGTKASVTQIGQGFSSIVVHSSTTTPSATMQKELSMLSKFGAAATTSLGKSFEFASGGLFLSLD